MDFSFPLDEARFRADLCCFLERTLPAGWGPGAAEPTMAGPVPMIPDRVPGLP